MANLARFIIVGSVGGSSPSADRGYDAVTSEVLTCSLEGGPANVVHRWTLEVYSVSEPDAPRASPGAPLLTLVGATSGQKVDASTPAANITITVPSGVNAWIVRSKVNGGQGPNDKANADYVFERMVVVRDGSGRRKTIATEATQYDAEGWAEAVATLLTTSSPTLASGTDVGDAGVWNGSIYVPRRGWIIVDYDVTGAVDATTAIQTALATASSSATRGRCVQLPYGICKVGSTHGSSNLFTVPYGCTVVGEARGYQSSHRLFTNDSVNGSIPHNGTLLRVGASGHGTGRLFTMQYNSSVRDLEIWYAAQGATNSQLAAQPGGVPIAHGYTFYIDANQHAVTLENICAINPYDFIYCNGAAPKFTDIKAFPLRRGITLARISEQAWASRVRFNVQDGTFTGTTLRAWVLANATAFLVDGAEQFDITDCFAVGCSIGIDFRDEDADGAKSYGSFKGGGFDQCQYCVVVNEPSGLGGLGFKMQGCQVIPGGAAGAGYMVICQDTTAPAGPEHRPEIYMTDIGGHYGATMGRAVWVKSGSYSVVNWKGGRVHNIANELARNDSTSAGSAINLDFIGTKANAARVAGVGVINDRNGFTLPT